MYEQDAYHGVRSSDSEPHSEAAVRPHCRDVRSATLADLVDRCEKVMAHAWMVRTFVKHSEEVEAFPELMVVARAVFDVSRALESRRSDPVRYLRMLRAKLRRLRDAADQFRQLAPEASSHTNFRQAVVSMDACVDELQLLLDAARPLLTPSSTPSGAKEEKRAASEGGMPQR